MYSLIKHIILVTGSKKLHKSLIYIDSLPIPIYINTYNTYQNSVENID